MTPDRVLMTPDLFRGALFNRSTVLRRAFALLFVYTFYQQLILAIRT
jgi:ectoine hydroxylase-related dioxygenase (phytanoyl-CoA dioxygenase family)